MKLSALEEKEQTAVRDGRWRGSGQIEGVSLAKSGEDRGPSSGDQSLARNLPSCSLRLQRPFPWWFFPQALIWHFGHC